jgi:nucleoid-associated protein YejK
MMDEILKQLMSIIAPTVVTAVGVVLTWGLNELRRFVRGRTDNEAIDFSFKQFNFIATGAVKKAEQEMKKYAADGKITKEEAAKIKDTVFNEVKKQIPERTEVMLRRGVNDLDDLINTRIEEIVYNEKERRRLG